MKLNDRMAALYSPGFIADLPARLEELLSGGFTRRDESVFLTKLLESSGTENRAMFEDEIAYECAMNHFHFQGGTGQELASTAVEFCRRLRSEWRQTGFPGELQWIVSIKDNECTIRFHLVRGGLQWLADDLNLYQDTAILVGDTISQQEE